MAAGRWYPPRPRSMPLTDPQPPRTLDLRWITGFEARAPPAPGHAKKGVSCGNGVTAGASARRGAGRCRHLGPFSAPAYRLKAGSGAYLVMVTTAVATLPAATRPWPGLAPAFPAPRAVTVTLFEPEPKAGQTVAVNGPKPRGAASVEAVRALVPQPLRPPMAATAGHRCRRRSPARPRPCRRALRRPMCPRRRHGTGGWRHSGRPVPPRPSPRRFRRRR
jgi:hypothetical protein